ncbi:hypothetical protein BX600DRAFT_434439 [Xylariales sp. PMI_506]|nr:hypothetical protein BX600DRAFT_434439 [Xylariales sp. PMI_506]
MTINANLTWTSHLVRRAIFTVNLPIGGVLYAIVSFGPPVHVVLPCLLAAIVGFLSCLAIAECNGLLMETWDCSDLQPGITGRSRNPNYPRKRTNYSAYPRVQAGFAVIHSLGFLLAAGATGIGGVAQRSLGQRAASAVVASILLILTIMLLCVLIRFRRTQVIPSSRTIEMDKWTEERKSSCRRRATMIAAAKVAGQQTLDNIPEDDVGWRPIIIGNPSEKTRRMNVLELGSMTRWTEIRKKNRLIDERAHLNCQALGLARIELENMGHEVLGDIQRGGAIVSDLVRKISKRSKSSQNSSGNDAEHVNVGVSQTTLTGLGHDQQSHPPQSLVEMECIMGQRVPEELDETSGLETDENQQEQKAQHRTLPGSSTNTYGRSGAEINFIR